MRYRVNEEVRGVEGKEPDEMRVTEIRDIYRENIEKLNRLSSREFSKRLGDAQEGDSWMFKREIPFEGNVYQVNMHSKKLRAKRHAQLNVFFEEFSDYVNVIKQQYRVEEGDLKYLLMNVISEIGKNSIDHARADFVINGTFSVKNEGLLFEFVLADKGPGIRARLAELFSSAAFREKFLEKYKHETEFAKRIIDTFESEGAEGLAKKYYNGHGFSTGNGVATPEDISSGHNRAAFLDYGLDEAIKHAKVDILLHDGDHTHVFANRMGRLDTKRDEDIPYTMYYEGAKLFPRNDE